MTYLFRARRRRMMSTVVLAVAAGFLGMAPATAVPAIDQEPAAKARAVCPSASPTFLSCSVSATTTGNYEWSSTSPDVVRRIRGTGTVECVDSTFASGGTMTLKILYKKRGETEYTRIVYNTYQIPSGRSTATVAASRVFTASQARQYFKSEVVYNVTCVSGRSRQSFSGTKTSAELVFEA